MNALLQSLEAAEAGSRELDWLLATEIGGFVIKGEVYGEPAFCQQDEGGGWVHPGQSGDQMVPRYTSSLNAALALAERVLDQRGPININICLAGSAQVVIDCVGPCDPIMAQVVASTPALAICAAILKARQSPRANGGET